MAVIRKQGRAGGHQPRRSLRADAALNRERILDAAEQVFAKQGPGASTELVAKRAGVGVGTIFRHFPTKEALLLDLLRTGMAHLADEADAVAPEREDALFQFFERFVAQASKKNAVVSTLASTGVDAKAFMVDAGAALRAAIGRLLVRAQHAGLVRKDVGATEVLGLLIGLANAADQARWDARMQRNTLRIVFDGLRR
jgi:AcrR family transcriptional regulator